MDFGIQLTKQEKRNLSDNFNVFKMNDITDDDLSDELSNVEDLSHELSGDEDVIKELEDNKDFIHVLQTGDIEDFINDSDNDDDNDDDDLDNANDYLQPQKFKFYINI